MPKRVFKLMFQHDEKKVFLVQYISPIVEHEIFDREIFYSLIHELRDHAYLEKKPSFFLFETRNKMNERYDQVACDMNLTVCDFSKLYNSISN